MFQSGAGARATRWSLASKPLGAKSKRHWGADWVTKASLHCHCGIALESLLLLPCIVVNSFLIMGGDKEVMMVEVEVEKGGEEMTIPSKDDTDNSTKKRVSVKASSSKPGTVVRRRLKKKVEVEDTSTKLIKYAALFLLVAQMVGLVLLMRYSRTHRRPDQPLYLASTAVFVMEVMKFVICCVVIAYQSGGNLIGEFQDHVFGAPMEIAKLCVPSLLYTVQNNLLYLALTNLDAATYQVCYQLKILTTAIFSAILLHVRSRHTLEDSLVKAQTLIFFLCTYSASFLVPSGRH
jgi:hypothetical protein